MGAPRAFFERTPATSSAVWRISRPKAPARPRVGPNGCFPGTLPSWAAIWSCPARPSFEAWLRLGSPEAGGPQAAPPARLTSYTTTGSLNALPRGKPSARRRVRGRGRRRRAETLAHGSRWPERHAVPCTGHTSAGASTIGTGEGWEPLALAWSEERIGWVTHRLDKPRTVA